MLLANDLNQLLDILPTFISNNIRHHPCREQLIEIVLDIGRRPEVRFSNSTEYLSYRTVVWQDLDHIFKRLGKFSKENRAGIEKTLHRISSLRNSEGIIIGLTCRIGRAIFGTVSIIRDLLEQKRSILLLGRPGVGKTTAIREIARILSDGMQKRVIIIDTSNEIAGDGDLPHPSIGKARRMQVSKYQNQNEVMIEAVENHMPEIIIIDEIGTELEAATARTIAERGVQLIGTAHGNTLKNLIKNPTITDLIGGVQHVILGDDEAKRRGSAKSVVERKSSPTFDTVVEIHDPNTWAIHDNIEQSVDLLLQGRNFPIQKRSLIKNKNTETLVDCKMFYIQETSKSAESNFINFFRAEKKNDTYLPNPLQAINKPKAGKSLKNNEKTKNSFDQSFTFLYLYAIPDQNLKSLIKILKLPIIITKEIQYADVILTLGNLVRNNKKLKQLLHSKKVTIHTLNSTNLLQIAKVLTLITKSNLVKIIDKKQFDNSFRSIRSREFLTPLEETRLAIEDIVISNKIIVDLYPRSSKVRKQQHELISHYCLHSVTVGKSKNKRIRIFPDLGKDLLKKNKLTSF